MYLVIVSVPFRVTPIRQIKAWLVGNGWPFTRAATQSWRIGVAPSGRVWKGPFPARHALRLTPSRLAEWYRNYDEVYECQ
ncbi:MAG: hypothetical protein ABW170_18080 [Candidatus Thiodiazotropha sp. L084R]